MTQSDKIKQELKSNCEKHRKELLNLMEAYDLAVLANDMQEQRIKDCYNEVLKEHAFYSIRECNDLKIGDRITDETNDFCMSEDDFKVYNENYCLEKTFKAGITDNKGYYVVNTFKLMCEAKRTLVEFITDKIVPSGLRTDMWRIRERLTIQEKLIKITKEAFGIAA